MLLCARLLSRHRMLAAVAAALVAAIGASTSVAADAARPPGSSAARSTAVPILPRKTRDELIREWDINSDGKIDVGEAEVAASRMRLERATMRLNTGFDPVTGRPRGEPEPKEEPVEDEKPGSDLAAELDAATQQGKPKPAPRTTTSGTQSAKSGAALFPTQRPLPATGGVRAGAQAARPGYGAAPAPSLNAGRPLATAQPSPGPRPLNAAASAQQPAGALRTSGPMAPGANGAAQRPRGGLLPRPPLQPPPRSRDLYDPY
jgi:hypothetical protein